MPARWWFECWIPRRHMQRSDPRRTIHPALLAASVYSDRFPLLGADCKPSEPALIFHAKLPRTVNAGLPENDGLHTIDAGIIQYVLVAGTFGAAVGRIGVERTILTNAARGTLVGIAAVSFYDPQIRHLAV